MKVSLERSLNFEKVISSISSRFVGKINLDDVINSSFQDMGYLSNVDRVSLFLFDEESNYLNNTHEWCGKGVSSQIYNLQQIENKIVSWLTQQVEKISFINIRDVSNLPISDKVIKKFMESLNIKAFLAFPIYENLKITGFVSYTKILEKYNWKVKEFAMLRVFAQILGDTGERLNAEKALQESQELLRATFEATADGIIAVDDDGGITHMNARFIYMWRIPEEIVEQKHFDKLLKHILNQLKNPQIFLSKLELIEKTSNNAYDMISFNDGRIFEQFTCPMVHDGLKVGRVWSFKDITEHQHAEQELRRSEKQFREAYERAEFFKDIFSHDMNNIFHNIMSSAELISMMKEGLDGWEKFQDLFHTIESQINRGVKLINNIRKLSKLEESQVSLEVVEITQVLEEAIEFGKKSVQERELELKVNKYDEEIFTEANEFLLDVFENILHNAIKYNENQTIQIQIDITKEQEEDKAYIKLEFKDNGIGIIDQKRELIFQKGHKPDNYKNGMGIGMSLVKKIVESYEGKIWVENRIEEDYTQGSNFIILIPAST